MVNLKAKDKIKCQVMPNKLQCRNVCVCVFQCLGMAAEPVVRNANAQECLWKCTPLSAHPEKHRFIFGERQISFEVLCKHRKYLKGKITAQCKPKTERSHLVAKVEIKLHLNKTILLNQILSRAALLDTEKCAFDLGQITTTATLVCGHSVALLQPWCVWYPVPSGFKDHPFYWVLLYGVFTPSLPLDGSTLKQSFLITLLLLLQSFSHLLLPLFWGTTCFFFSNLIWCEVFKSF